MTFASPLFLWALTALALPIVIHLFNFRRYKKVYFTNVKFLKELQQESKSRSRLKELLVLLFRCLTIAALVLAFSQPVIKDEKSGGTGAGKSAVSIYVDNSYSMDNVSKQGPLLQVAKAQAKDIITAFNNADRFQIITNDFEGKHQRFHTKEDALNVLEEIKPSSAVRLLGDVLKRQSDFLSSAHVPNKKIIALSDAQKSTFNIEAATIDTAIKTILIPLAANQVNNVYVDSCWFETPLQQKGFIQKLHVKIVNNGSSVIEAGTARLTLNKEQAGIASFSIEANSNTEIKFTFESKLEGFNYGSVKIDDYPIHFDDELFFAFNAEPHVNITLINGAAQKSENSFSSLFRSDSLFYFRNFSELTIDYSSFKTSDILVLNQLRDLSSGLVAELLKFTAQGGAIVIIPALDANRDSYSQALAALQLPALTELDSVPQKSDKIEYASSFYKGVFEKVEERMNLPLVNKHFKLQKTSHTDFETILSLQNGDSFFGVTRFNNARLYLFSVPLNETCSNFTKHALFVPTFYQMSFSSLQAPPLFYPVSLNVIIPLKNDLSLTDQAPHIRQIEGEADMIPEVRVINNALSLYTRGQISVPGYYEVMRNNVRILPLAFNYSRKESDLRSYTKDELEKIIAEKGWRSVRLIDDTSGSVSAQVMFETEGKKLWKLFIILALLFIVIEVSLLRLLK
ncbi:MAG: BatA and WFA domain-containing protein [bacterium]|nr:BatA and WFA domain-containing protein [bacterium]